MATRKSPPKAVSKLRGKSVRSSANSSSAKSVQSVIAESLPGWSLVGTQPTGSKAFSTPAPRAAELEAAPDLLAPSADAVMPSIESLQQRYRVEPVVTDAAPGTSAEAPLSIVEVEAAGLKKKVAIEGGRVKWSQG